MIRFKKTSNREFCTMTALFGYNLLKTDDVFRRQFLGAAVGEEAILRNYRVTRFVRPYPTIEAFPDNSVAGLLFRDVSDESIILLDRRAISDGMARQKFDVMVGDEIVSADAYVPGDVSLIVRRGVAKPVRRYCGHVEVAAA